MSGKAAKKFLEVFFMWNNGFCGNNCWWIIILVLLFCNCGGGCGTTYGGNGCGNGCGNWDNNNCGCC